MSTGGEEDRGHLPNTLVRAIRRDPARAADLAVLYAWPHLVPEAERWRRRRDGRAERNVDEVSRRLIRRTVALARRDGALAGTSFYVGLPAALASMYLHQLLMVLEIAELYGHDPADPARAAEILVIQGRYDTPAAAAAALRTLGSPRTSSHRHGPVSAVIEAMSHVPSIIGLKVRSVRSGNVVSIVLAVLQIVSYLVPVLSMPVCAASSAQATRRLGRSAREYYSTTPSSKDAPDPFPLPTRRGYRVRHLESAALVMSGLAVVGLSLLWTVDHHGIRIGLVLAEGAVAVTFARLWWITRPGPRPGVTPVDPARSRTIP